MEGTGERFLPLSLPPSTAPCPLLPLQSELTALRFKSVLPKTHRASRMGLTSSTETIRKGHDHRFICSGLPGCWEGSWLWPVVMKKESLEQNGWLLLPEGMEWGCKRHSNILWGKSDGMAGQQEAMTGDKARLTQLRKLSRLLEGQQSFFMLAVHTRNGLLFTLSGVLGGQMSPCSTRIPSVDTAS